MLVKHLHCIGRLPGRCRAHSVAASDLALQNAMSHQTAASAASARRKQRSLCCDPRQHPVDCTTAQQCHHHAS